MVRDPASSAAGERAAGFATTRDHLPWALLAILACLLAWGYRASASRLAFTEHGQWWLGVAAALALLSGYLYSARKRWGFARFRPLRPVYLAHVWLSSAGFAIALLHANFSARGWPERALLLGCGAALVSGFLLSGFHAVFQALMLRLEDEHMLPEDITEARLRATLELEELRQANRPELHAAALRATRRQLALPRLVRLLLETREAVIEERRRLYSGASDATLSKAELTVYRRLLELILESQLLRLGAMLHRLRSGLLSVHMLLASAMLALLALHVAIVSWFGA